ncbi:MAG TPA: hypothetical protein VF807_04470, partial [Ktedonobacterales bacterium]
GTPTPAGARALGVALLVAAALIVVYWLVSFGNRNIVAAAHTDIYYAWANSFPLADAWLVLSSALAGVWLLRGNPNAIFAQFLAGGAGVYLGLLGLLFDLENGIYVGRGGAGAAQVGMEIAVVVFTLALSGIGLWWAWRHRAWVTKA